MEPNLTPEQYLRTLRGAVRRLPALLGRWSDLSTEGREACVEQLQWFAATKDQAIRTAEEEGLSEVASAIAQEYQVLFESVGLRLSELEFQRQA